MKKLFFVLMLSLSLSLFSLIAKADYLKATYGLSSLGSDMSKKGGSATIDQDDSGFMINAGKTIWSGLGVEAMYYDLGESSIKGSVGDKITLDDATYVFTTAGTVSNETSGYGLGIFATTGNAEGLLSFSGTIRLGLHNWDRSGSTSLMYESSKAFDTRFYNDGVDMYFGIEVNAGLTDSLALNVSYDSMGFADEGSLDDSGSLASIGLLFNF